MIINFSNIRTIIVLCFVFGVACSPRPVQDGSSKNTISTNNETNNVINYKVNLQNGSSNSYQSRGISRRQDGILKTLKKSGEIIGDFEIKDDGDIKGEIIITDDSGSADSSGSSDDDEIVGSVNIDDDGNVEGVIHVPNDANPSNSNGTDTNIQGTTEQPEYDHDHNNKGLNKSKDGSVIKPIKLPDNYFEYPNSGDGEPGSKGAIYGNIHINDGEKDIAGDISGNIEINDGEGDNTGDISGNIDIHDSDEGNAGDISGNIDIHDGKEGNASDIAGNIDIHGGDGGNIGDISGNIDIHDGDGGNPGDISGNIDIHDGDEGNAGDISGNIDIHDGDGGNPGEISGNIDIHDGDGSNAGDISGNIDIHDGDGGNAGDISGNIDIHDGDGGNPGDISDNKDVYDVDGDNPEDISNNTDIHDDDGGNPGDISGNIDIHDGNEGNPGDVSGNIDIHDGDGGNPGDISGNIDIHDGDGSNAGDISGNIDIHDGNGGTGDISGNIEISDGEGDIEGEIKIKDDDDDNTNKIDKEHNSSTENGTQDNEGKTCWMSLNSQIYLDALDELDAKHEKARQEYQNEIGPAFDKQMMEVLLSSQGKAPRAIHQAQGDPSIIPAGLNLGGYGMMRMQGSLLFFHRLKLRNSTRFQVNFLQTSLKHMSLVARLSLHDLHLQGAYERTNTEGDMNVLYFVPNYGELNVLLKDVAYKMEGRLRMLNNRLMIELISSEIAAKDVLLTYSNSSSSTKVLAQDNIDDFVDRLKSDLDLWLKDYFNDYLMYFGIVGGKNTNIQVYEKQKTYKVNEYADYVIKVIKKRIRALGFDNILLPHLTIITATLQQVKLKSGTLRGFDSMYRRSVATTKKDGNIRKVDIIIGFSNLKVEYAYEAIFGPSQPMVTGTLVLSADELTGHLQLAQMDGLQTASINIDTIVQLKSEALTVEGPANRLIANFKYILENPVLAIMTNVLKHNLRMLRTLPGCEPKLYGEKGRQWQLAPYKPRFNTGSKPAENPTKADEGSPPFNTEQFPDREKQFIQTGEGEDEWGD